MAKAARKTEAPKKQAPRKTAVSQQPIPKVVEPLPKETASVTNITVEAQKPMVKWWYVVIAAVVLFFIIRGCIVKKQAAVIGETHKQIADTTQSIIVTKGHLDSLEAVIKQRDSLTGEAIRLAGVEEQKRIQAQTELQQARQTIDAYLSKQKVQSDVNKKVIADGSIGALVLYWDSVKLANRISPGK